MNDDFDLLASEYVIGLLDGDDLARARALEASNPEFQASVAFWRRRFEAIDETATPVDPAPDLWTRIEAATATVTPAKAPDAVRQKSVGIWSNLGFWRGAGLVGATASLALALLASALWNARLSTPTLVAVLVTDQNVPAAVVNAFADGTVELVPLSSIAVPEGKALEVWTLPSRERGPVSVALLDRARAVRLDLKDLPRPGSGQLFEITLEARNGSPIGRPTGPILMKGLTLEAL